MERKKIVILGAHGFTGRHFLRYMEHTGLTRRWEPVLIDRAAVDTPYISMTMDAADRKSLGEVLRNLEPAMIVNLMGVLRGTDWELFMRCNVGVSQTVLEYAAEAVKPVEKILLIGSAAEYGYVESNPVSETSPRRPVSLYGLSKFLQQEVAEYYFRKYGIPVVIARTFNLTGSGISNQLAIGAWREKIVAAADGDEVRFGNLESYRDYMEVGDVVPIYWKLLLHAPAGEIYNVCSGRPVQMRTLLDREIALSGKDIVIRIDPGLYRPDDLPIIYGDNAKLQHFLNEHPE